MDATIFAATASADAQVIEPDIWFDYSSPSSTDIAPMIVAGLGSTQSFEAILPPTDEEKKTLEPIYVYEPNPDDPWSLWLMLGRKPDGSPIVALNGEQDWPSD